MSCLEIAEFGQKLVPSAVAVLTFIQSIDYNMDGGVMCKYISECAENLIRRWPGSSVSMLFVQPLHGLP
jgi:hypothetical protein